MARHYSPLLGYLVSSRFILDWNSLKSIDEERHQKRQVSVQEADEGAQECVLPSLCSEASGLCRLCPGTDTNCAEMITWHFCYPSLLEIHFQNQIPFLLEEMSPTVSGGQGWEYIRVHIWICLDHIWLQAQDGKCDALPCPALLGAVSRPGLPVGFLWYQPGHSWGSLEAARAILGWEQPQSSRALSISIDLNFPA